MKDFVAIDFETANGKRTSICSVGLVVVCNGEIVDKYYSLVRPTPNYYAWFCQEVHGLDYCDTKDAPVFPEVWAEVETLLVQYFQYISDGVVPFVAHNARFDEGCLRAAFAAYDTSYPDYVFCDTLPAARRHFGSSLPNHQLHTVAAACGYDLTNHHHALADAEACAVIAMQIL